VKSDISEDTHEESDDSSDDLPPVGNGIYSVRMKLERNMPQLIPMHGKRIRLYYRGIIKRCTNCFGSHQRKNCKEEKVPWIKYVEQFITNYPEIPRESYGRWMNMIDGMSPAVDGNKTVVPEQSTSMGANSQQPTLKPSSKVGPKNSKPSTKTAEKDENETENEEEQGTERATEDVQKLIEALAGAGISTQDVLKMVVGKKKAANQRQKNMGSGRGRGGKTKK
jgi:hypothetical protein